MRRTLFLRFFFAICVVTMAVRAADESKAPKANPLVWDATEKTIDPKPGDDAAEFVFTVKNTADRPLEISELRPSCGCTVAEMPQTPWIIAPGASGSFRATIDYKGKMGKLSKTIFVDSTLGTQVLTVHVNIPENEETRRLRNQQMALADRQGVFRGDCAACHVAPTVGKTGGELFQLACGICHTAEHRASMVPDLAVAREPRDADYWRKWISEGKERTLMPAFAQAKGGPLTTEQIESLVAFALKNLPTEPKSSQ